ncbi:MAG: cyanophycinase [Flavobacteriaceae bacterium]|nr:cyanophycinase [Flavobacteriaceae bacterium]
MSKGVIIPIGGNEDKGVLRKERFTLEFVEKGILFRVLNEARGKDSRVVIIPTASNIPTEVANIYLEAFSKLGCKNIEILDIRRRAESEEDHSLGLIEKADCVMFSGGNQSKIIEHIGGTSLHNLLKERYENDKGFVIAGTSAGAMSMSSQMIAGGSSKESFIKGAVKMHYGLGFLPNLIIDSHFITRGRFGRLAEAVAKHTDCIGVGLAEDTGIIVKKGKEFEVIGSGMVLVFDPRSVKHNNEAVVSKGMPMSLTNLKTHVLANGDRFNIKRKHVKVQQADWEAIKEF